MNYADYKYYKDVYMGSLSEDLFNSLIPKASRKIDDEVNRELKEVDITDKVKFVACELVDFLKSNNFSNESNIESISIDGVSKRYAIKSATETRNTEKDILSSLPLELIRFL